jgi:hypothetical protein
VPLKPTSATSAQVNASRCLLALCSYALKTVRKQWRAACTMYYFSNASSSQTAAALALRTMARRDCPRSDRIPAPHRPCVRTLLRNQLELPAGSWTFLGSGSLGLCGQRGCGRRLRMGHCASGAEVLQVGNGVQRLLTSKTGSSARIRTRRREAGTVVRDGRRECGFTAGRASRVLASSTTVDAVPEWRHEAQPPEQHSRFSARSIRGTARWNQVECSSAAGPVIEVYV